MQFSVAEEDGALQLGSFQGRSLQRRRLLGSDSDQRAVELFHTPLHMSTPVSASPMSFFYSSDGTMHYDKQPRVTR